MRESTSVGVTIPAGLKGCQINQTRSLSVGGGTYSYRALLNGGEIAASSGATRSGTFFLDVDDVDIAPGGRLQLAFRYTAGAGPSASDGVWLDNVSLTCIQAVGQGTSYGFLDGTSMAAPHVTGAAALLFSLNPSASVAQVRSALMATVDRSPCLRAGRRPAAASTRPSRSTRSASRTRASRAPQKIDKIEQSDVHVRALRRAAAAAASSASSTAARSPPARAPRPSR